jgi:hypothetical protein
MGVEAPGFRVSEDTFKKVEAGHWNCIKANAPDVYIGLIMFLMNTGHPDLYKFVESRARSKEKPFLYQAGATLAYDVITSQLKADERWIEITEEDMERYRQSRDESPDEGASIFDDFIDDLFKVSPDLVKYIWEVGEALKVEGGEVAAEDFLEGVCDVGVPFLRNINK